MSLTLRDARVLRDALLADDDWDRAGHAYAAEHDRYYAIVRRADGWYADLFMELGPVADERRARALPLLAADPSRAIFNLHCPPYRSGLDEAPAIDADMKLMHGGRALRPVGSTAVREAIERHQPLISLHGHIHESKGAVKIGKTLSINPGSAYEEGMLMGAIIQLDPKKGIKSYQLVNG